MSCKIITIDLANVPPIPIRLGVAGENTFRTFTFDATEWGADFPGATYTVVYKRPDGYLYPVLVNAAADAIVWSPTDTDTATSGSGLLEVRLLDGETVGKTITMQTVVAPSLTGNESTPPQPAPDWVNDVADDADRAEAAVSHYPKIVNGVWYVWSVQAEDFVSTGIEAQGEDGYSPTVTVTEIDGGHRVTITDADGAHTFDVMDGEHSQGGAVESVNGKTGTVVLDASDVGALPDDTPIPAAVTEQTVSGWGFTKNTGTYSKPSGGIPASDLASAVQTSLGKAETALQQHQSLIGYATETWVDGKGYQTAAEVQSAIAAAAELPTVTASDNGKFLRVVNGAWAAETVQTWQGGSY